MSIKRRLGKLETTVPPGGPPRPLRRVHLVDAPTPEEAEANRAKLIAEGASPGDMFIELVPAPPDPTSHMFENYRWEGRWVPKDSGADAN